MSRNKSEFRCYDNRQKYLMFVNTCTEKLVGSRRNSNASVPRLRQFGFLMQALATARCSPR